MKVINNQWKIIWMLFGGSNDNKRDIFGQISLINVHKIL